MTFHPVDAAASDTRPMRVLFVMGTSHLPDTVGGVQSTIHALALRLVEDGHEPAVFCRQPQSRTKRTWPRILNSILGRSHSADREMGYATFRGRRHSGLGDVLARFPADVAVVNHKQSVPFARRLHAAGVPVVFYFQVAHLKDVAGDPGEISGACYIANSRFTAYWASDNLGVQSEVIPPYIDPGQYATQSSRENVTFIAPIPLKGVEVAIATARLCPEIPFAFVESWGLTDRQALVARLRELPNITLLPPREDMKPVYGRARIVLAPSQVDETWGRIASEAHCSGIPVIASRRGGLPEAVGEGGLLLDHDAPAEEWAQAVRRLWNDQALYEGLSQAATRYASRRELDPEWQYQTLLRVIQRARQQQGLASPPHRSEAQTGA